MTRAIPRIHRITKSEEKMAASVAQLEQQVGVHDLNRFRPQ